MHAVLLVLYYVLPGDTIDCPPMGNEAMYQSVVDLVIDNKTGEFDSF